MHKMVMAVLAVAVMSPPIRICALSSQPGQSVDAIGDGGPATKAILVGPSGIAVDAKRNLFIGERSGHRVRRVDAKTGFIMTVAGTGSRGYSGDGGLALQANLANVEHIAIDTQGNLYIGDRGNSRVRRVDAKTGIITTVAGNGVRGYSGDGGLAVEASISNPYGLSVDPNGNIFIADTENQCIRRVDAKSGLITTVAGSGQRGFGGDGGPAIKANLSRPHVAVIDPKGNLIIGDSFNQRIRKVDRRTGIITTIAGTGEESFSGDGGPALKASFRYFGAFAYDASGHLFITDGGNNRIRKVDAQTGNITTIAGTGEPVFSGDDGPAIQAKIRWPYGLAVDKQGNIFFADWENHRVRRIDAGAGVITTVAGGRGQ